VEAAGGGAVEIFGFLHVASGTPRGGSGNGFSIPLPHSTQTSVNSAFNVLHRGQIMGEVSLAKMG
jgi:hypothetical protein